MDLDNRTFSGTISTKSLAHGRRHNGQPNPIDVYIGKRIRLRREQLSLTQHKFGQALGLAFQQVQKYENGANRVSASRLWDIAQLLRVDFSYFFAGLNEADKNNSPRVMAGAPFTKNFIEIPEDPLYREDVLCLVNNYLKIGNPQTAKQLRDLATVLRGRSLPPADS